MNTQRWGIVAAFLGLLGMVGLWYVMSSASSTGDPVAASAPPEKAAAENVDPNDLFRGDRRFTMKAMPIDPAKLRTLKEPMAARDLLSRGRAPGVGPKLPGQPAGGGVYMMDEVGVKSAVESRRVDLEACYTSAKLHEPGLRPETTLNIAVAPKDGATYSEVEGVSTGSPTFDACATTAMDGLRFATGTPTSLRYPMTLGSGG